MTKKSNPLLIKQKDYSRYPFMNLSLSDMPKEEWVAIPGFDGCFYVSQYGRIWSLARPINSSDGHFYYTKERIRKQSLTSYYNSHSKEFTVQLSVHIRYEGASYRFAVNRLVYEAFIGPIDDKALVVHSDGDNCNNHYKNLVLMNGTQLYRHGLELSRRPRIGLKQKKGKRLVWSDKNHPRPIVQYSLDGKKLNEYESVAHASTENNSGRGAIRAVATQRAKQLNGFVYRYKGEKYKGEHAGYSRSKSVTQYSISGKSLSVYPSLVAASLKTGIDADSISKCALRKARLAGGYVWRFDQDIYKGEYEGKIKTSKPVIQYSLEGSIVARFSSINQASRETGYSAATIQACTRKLTRVSHGYVWRFEFDKYRGEYKNYRRGKPVTQHNLIGKALKTFPTIEAAAKATGLTPDNIQKNAKGENKTAGGFIWKYATRSETRNLPSFKTMYDKSLLVGKPVIQYSIDGKKLATYTSIAQAASSVGINVTGISVVLDKPGRSSAGFVWRSKGNRYYGEIAKNPSPNAARIVSQYDLRGKRISNYKSTKEAERKTGLSASTISAVASGKLRTTGGFIWLYGNGPKKLETEAYFSSTRMKLEKTFKPVMKLSLEGEELAVYPSIAYAARMEGVSAKGISRVVNGKQHSCGGYFWEVSR